jgi:selenocysteine lyase/cysteine desulfurase
LGRLCRERKLIFVVDATQGMGVFPIDVVSSGIDFLVFSGYKWAQAGYGIGGLYVAPRFLNPTSFPVAGWWSVRDPEAVVNDRLDLKESAQRSKLAALSLPAFRSGRRSHVVRGDWKITN